MEIRRLDIAHFRGFDQTSLQPKGNVVLMGERGAGRSDVLEALHRLLDFEGIRSRVVSEEDYYNKDLSQNIVLETTICNLGTALENDFFDHLEVWDKATQAVVDEIRDASTLNSSTHEWALRIGYHARWLHDQERAEEIIFYPKSSDPDQDEYTRVRRADLEKLGFSSLRTTGGRILDLGARSTFRQLIERSLATDFSAAVDGYVQSLAQAAAEFSHSGQVLDAVNNALAPLHDLLHLGSAQAPVQFVPEGGAATALLRSLAPALDMEDGLGPFPAWRRGSTVSSLLRISESLALAGGLGGVISVDDLGDGMDSGAAVHMASYLKSLPGQTWITTRVSSVAEVFEPSEVFRLGRDSDGNRFHRQGKVPSADKVETLAAKHWHRNLLPAFCYRAVVIVEGPHDFAALHALGLRKLREVGAALPATQGVVIVSAAAAGSGGYAVVTRLAQAAREMGLRAVGIIDGDVASGVLQYVIDHATDADVLIRLPDGFAIERAIVQGLSDDNILLALQDAASAVGLTVPAETLTKTGNQLLSSASAFIKDHSLHAQFVEASPSIPPFASKLLETAVSEAIGSSSGLVQL